jgi:dTDP-4-dehydrorhamnose reductase
MLDLRRENDSIKAVSDETNSLTYAPDLALAVKNLIKNHWPFGIYHITNSGSASWYDFAKEIFTITGKKINLIPVPSSAFPRTAVRPKHAVLITTKLPALRPWQEALSVFLRPSP